jgi:hypothetical protein
VAQVRKVRTGAEDAAGIAILDGIKSGDKIVIMTASPIKDGQQVKVNTEGKSGTAVNLTQSDNVRKTP